MGEILRVQNVTRRFGGLLALDRASLTAGDVQIVALLAASVGGIGTVYGPLLGALVVRLLGEATKLVTGQAPGLDLVIYGCVLVLVVAFAPRGIAGQIASLRGRFRTERAHG